MTLAFTLSLTRPAWLWVLAAVPVFVALTLRVTRGRPRAGDWAALAARTFLLAVLALALGAPRVDVEGKGRSVAYVLDVSESVPPQSLAEAQAFVKESASRRADEDDAAFLVFADGAAVEAPFARLSASRRTEAAVIDPANVATRLPRGESDVDGALRLARASFPPGGARRVVLLTDGNETRGDAVAAVKELLDDKVDVQIVPIRYQREHEVLVEKVVAPAAAGTETPVPVRVVVQSTFEKVRAKIRFLVDDAEVVARDETLHQGANVFEMGHRFASRGFHRIEAVVEPEEDGDPANNHGRAAVIVSGRGRVLVVGNAPKSPLAEALRANLEDEVDVGGVDSVPSDPGGFVPYDAIVLENVPAFALSDVQRRMLAAAVRDVGVGLVCVGGPATYGPGGYAGTEIEEVLPVSCDVSQKRVLPAGALVVVLHTCEFPDGNAAARKITKLALSALSAQDEFGVLDFDMRDGDHWVVELQRVADKQKLGELIDGANPADMPSFDSIVRMAHRALKASSAAAKHMIIISDGDPVPPNSKLAQEIADDRITISAVEVDPHGARGSLQALAEAHGGRFYSVDSSRLEALPQIFVKEAVTIRRAAVREEPFRPQVRGLDRMIRDFAESDFPALRGRVVTSMKPGAEEILAADEEDPLLASWRCGLARAVAWTSDASAWAQDWAAWSGYGRFWSQVVKSSRRALVRAGAHAAADVAGGAAHVALDALRADGSFANGLDVRGVAVLPDGTTEKFRVEQKGPGRYEGEFAAKEVGAYLATLTYDDPAAPGETAQVQASVCVAYSAEHLAQRSNENFFGRAAAAGATTIDVAKMDDVLTRDPKAPNARDVPWTGPAAGGAESIELWPWIAAAAAFLLVVDVAVRRVRVPWERILRRRAPAAAGKRVAADGPPKRVVHVDAGAGVVSEPPPPPAAHEPPRPAPGPPAGDAASSGGLLDAKRRAKKKQTWEENP
jgi:uncharacterized membrane protein